jgi:hypothetical protein
VILAACAVLLPVTLVSTTASASTAASYLTVTTYDRGGAKVKAPLRLINLENGAEYTGTSLVAKKLGKGKYAVLTDISTAKDGSDTLGARVLKVSGRTTTTIDARAGKPIKVAIDKNPGSQFAQDLRAQICANGPASSTDIGAWNSPGKLFVIPNSSKSLQFAYNSSWSDTSVGSLWMVSGITKSAVPAGITRVARAASLATITGVIKRGPGGGDSVDLRLEEGDSCHAGYGASAYGSGVGPVIAKIHTTPGSWRLEADWWATETNGNPAMIGFDWRTLKVAAGKSYTHSFFNAAWGPGRNLPNMYGKYLRFETSLMFTDPANDEYSEASERSLVTLYDGAGKVVKSQWRTDWEGKGSDFEAKVKKKGWYRLQVDAQRYRPGIKYPAGMLSTRAQAVFGMKLDPKAKSRYADVILPRLVPLGLSMTNQAKGGSSTVVQIRPDRRLIDPDLQKGKVTARTVSVQASFDNGKTWRSVAVTKSGNRWLATVKNPASGAVALRSRITTTKSEYAQVTIYRAYAIG